MLSRAQEARVRDALANHPPGTIQTDCLEHLAAGAQIPRGHLADLAAFVRTLREHGECETRVEGMCDAHCHQTSELLIWGHRLRWPRTTFVHPAMAPAAYPDRFANRLR